MKPFNYFDFIIKYQLGLAIDYQETVNNPEYKKIIDNYFKLITEDNELKHKRMIDEIIEKKNNYMMNLLKIMQINKNEYMIMEIKNQLI